MKFDNNDLMYGGGGAFPLVFELRSTIFDPFSSLKTHFSSFSFTVFTEGLLFSKIKISNVCGNQYVSEASRFRLNHNIALASKQKSVQDTKTLHKNSIHFLPEL